MMFFNFSNFFFEFSIPGRVGTEFGMNFFFFNLLLGLSQLGFKRYKAGMRFFNFLNFFFYFFGNFYLGWVWSEFGRKFILSYSAYLNPVWIEIMPELSFLIFWIFFLSFSVYLIPVWIDIMPKWCFLIFWIFLLFFLEFSSPSQIETEFETKFLFSLSRRISSRFGYK